MNENPAIELILASASPRRREMLERIGLGVTVRPSHREESRRDSETAEQYALRNAGEKARHVAAMLPASRRSVVIGADTIVVLDDHILEKPRDVADARAMLRKLGGRSHVVITGVSVIGVGFPGPRREFDFATRTKVEFKILRDVEMDAYIASGEPMDKAGAYAIQGLGAYMIRRIDGSYTNVVGLPLSELADLLEKEFAIFPQLGHPNLEGGVQGLNVLNRFAH